MMNSFPSPPSELPLGYNDSMKSFFLFIVLGIFVNSTFAESSLRFEPVYGVEHTELREPKPSRTVTQATLGGRILYGTPLLSSEFELTRSQGKRTYDEGDITSKDEITRLQIGLRSQYQLLTFLGWYLRGGLSAKKQKSEITQNGVTSTEEPSIQFGPYAGSGLQFYLGSFFSLNGGAILIYQPQAEEKKYDVQYTLGFSFHLGNG
jgi:hypothetical protein